MGFPIAAFLGQVLAPALVEGAKHAVKETSKTFFNNLFDNAYSLAVTSGVQWLDKNIEMPDFLQDSVNSALYAGAYSFRSKVENSYQEKRVEFNKSRKEIIEKTKLQRKKNRIKAMTEGEANNEKEVMIENYLNEKTDKIMNETLDQIDKGYNAVIDTSQSVDLVSSGMSDVSQTKHQSIMSQNSSQDLVRQVTMDINNMGTEKDENTNEWKTKDKGWNGMTIDEIMGKYILGKGVV